MGKFFFYRGYRAKARKNMCINRLQRGPAQAFDVLPCLRTYWNALSLTANTKTYMEYLPLRKSVSVSRFETVFYHKE